MPGPTVWNVAAYIAQIACVTLLAEGLLRLAPVRSAAFRYTYWRVALVSALLMPWLFGLAAAPAQDATNATTPLATMLGAPAELFRSGAGQAAATSDGSRWLPLVLAVLAAGIGARLSWLAAGAVRLRALRHRGVAVADPSCDELQRALGTQAELRFVSNLPQPATFGVRRPVVLLPATLASSAESTRRAVVAHELVHVRHRDWAWVVVEELLCAALWFHPAIWWLVSRVQLTREEVTDREAVLATGNRRAYMEALLAFADAPAGTPAPAFARRAHLFRRLVLLSRKENAMSARRLGFSAALLAAPFLAGAWYSSETFPLLAGGRSVLIAAGQPLTDGVNIVTPENPIPRRLSGPAVPYPLELAGTGFAAQVRVPLVIDATGSVTAGSASVRLLDVQPGSDTERERAVEAFASVTRDAITTWQYEPPVEAPLGLAITLRFFGPGQETIVAQEEYGANMRPGSRSPRLMDTLVVGRPGSFRVGSGLFAQTNHVEPVYPEAARSARIGGVVILEATIDERGRVSNPRILRSVPVFDAAVLDAVRQWKYVPTLLNGVPVPVNITWTIQFLPPE